MFLKRIITIFIFRVALEMLSNKLGVAKWPFFKAIHKKTKKWKRKNLIGFLLIIPAAAITFPIAYLVDYNNIVSAFLIAFSLLFIDLMFKYK
ncbi:hypothetical protein HYG86_18000 [Alkalicella caledoniensis]|uniref:Uncharacterized protein n=1 Tax=Alkalicella caledoniensis TaxID=2731377 RepID=A0A7G9WCW9_ALKCA|nr:hypothetical protein [Alkalicella caledoniensis]QNO16531.1 hypothetical protein HYG86_18000 [Alkalicella caledoniensis]